MPRVYAYCRVSTKEQSTQNQVEEIKIAGFDIAPHRIVEEEISGGVVASQRPGFARLMERLEPGDMLVCTKLDRLGRNALDVRQTVENLAARGVKVACLGLGGATDLTSSAGKMLMGVVAAMAEFERDLLIERTQAGLARAKAEGRVTGRPWRLTEQERRSVRDRLGAGATVSQLAREFGVDRRLIQRARAAAP
ncbi:recombinase family protein [Methylocystis sp. H62]|uniref:recombinase family protein n=1 Tax=Methylocystis sp. H62 TaxID=2785789 RepID=UPI0018C2B61A|nr:recombinase family protein [Methylocystis sp. H62]MBG0795853.1 recombinase family protein [Methylocystis sp. H62]